MKKISSLSLALLAMMAVACSTTASRIGDQQAVFDSYPPAVQQKISAGQVAVGFTPEQVRLALGKPDRIYTRETEAGNAEVWAYRESKPAFSLGIGGFSGGSTSVGGGIGVGTGGDSGEDKTRVTFSAGVVSAIEQSAK